ncbi:MAG: hypothetical protein AAEJ53_05835 [Myxococcota bacterium]
MQREAEEVLGLLRDARVDPAAVRERLDGFGHDARLELTRALGPREQRRLYEAVAGFETLALADLVPPHVGDMHEVRHFGRNTLPAFTHFEKRFCRPAGASAERPERLYGYNHAAVRPLVGPGYFVARASEPAGEVLVDYNQLPSAAPEGWPGIRRNEVGVSRFVYGFMVDSLRRVSEHVSIGSAARHGREMGSWFVLCREA